MADVDTQYLSAEHSDMRREAVAHTNEIVKENLKGVYPTPISELQANAKIVASSEVIPTPEPTCEPILETEVVPVIEEKTELPKDDLVERLRGLLESRKLVSQ